MIQKKMGEGGGGGGGEGRGQGGGGWDDGKKIIGISSVHTATKTVS